jgi:hypothetical protein
VIVKAAPRFNSPVGLGHVRQELKQPQDRSKDRPQAKHEITLERPFSRSCHENDAHDHEMGGADPAPKRIV